MAFFIETTIIKEFEEVNKKVYLVLKASEHITAKKNRKIPKKGDSEKGASIKARHVGENHIPRNTAKAKEFGSFL